MDLETLIWTLLLFGGTVVAVVWLIWIAWRREKDHVSDGDADTDTQATAES